MIAELTFFFRFSSLFIATIAFSAFPIEAIEVDVLAPSSAQAKPPEPSANVSSGHENYEQGMSDDMKKNKVNWKHSHRWSNAYLYEQNATEAPDDSSIFSPDGGGFVASELNLRWTQLRKGQMTLMLDAVWKEPLEDSLADYEHHYLQLTLDRGWKGEKILSTRAGLELRVDELFVGGDGEIGIATGEVYAQAIQSPWTWWGRTVYPIWKGEMAYKDYCHRYAVDSSGDSRDSCVPELSLRLVHVDSHQENLLKTMSCSVELNTSLSTSSNQRYSLGQMMLGVTTKRGPYIFMLHQYRYQSSYAGLERNEYRGVCAVGTRYAINTWANALVQSVFTRQRSSITEFSFDNVGFKVALEVIF